MTALVVFRGDVVIVTGNCFCLLPGERSLWQSVRFRHEGLLKCKKPLLAEQQGLWGLLISLWSEWPDYQKATFSVA